MNQEEFIKSFMEFEKLMSRKIRPKNEKLNIELFKIWYANEIQEWINLRHFNSDDNEHLSKNRIKLPSDGDDPDFVYGTVL